MKASFSARVRPIADRASPRGSQLRAVRRFADSSALTRFPRGTKAWPARYGHVRGVWVQTAGASPENGALLYLHGGGFVFGSPRSHRAIAYRLSKLLKLPVFLLDYRRAPEHPFPAAADDALDAYRVLLDRGFSASKLLVAGDSAGGHLTASLMGDLARLKLPQPAGAYLVSPWLDLTVSSGLIRDRRQRDPFLSPAYMEKARDAYVARTPWGHPRLDVLGADKSGWPPMLLQVGDTELLLDEAERFADEASQVKLSVWPGQIHAFPVFAGLPEARAAVQEAADFLQPLLTGCQ